jgi:hypothetical protein
MIATILTGKIKHSGANPIRNLRKVSKSRGEHP